MNRTKRLAAAFVAAALLLTLTACKTSADFLRERAELADICHESGGVYVYNDVSGGYACRWDA